MDLACPKSIGTYSTLLFVLLGLTSGEVWAVEAQPSLSVVDPSPTVIAQMDTDDNILFRAEPGRSYCCEAYRQSPTSALDGASEARIGAVLSVTDGGTGAVVPSMSRGLASPVVPLPRQTGASPADPDASRRCFTAVTNTLHACTIQFGANADNVTNVAVQVRETTLFGGFNTSVTDFNFLEIRNISNVPITAAISAVDTVSGQTVISNLTRDILAGTRLDVDIHSLTGPGRFGPVVITHDGPYGSLQVQLSQYNITTPVPLTFVPAAVELFRPR